MQIYDVIKYLEDHPGGADVLLEATGTAALTPDSVFLFLSTWVLVSCMVIGLFDDAGHSKSAIELMQDYF